MFKFGLNLSTPVLLIRRKILRSFNWLHENTLEGAKTLIFCFIKNSASEVKLCEVRRDSNKLVKYSTSKSLFTLRF
jgi:hypothetical protein